VDRTAARQQFRARGAERDWFKGPYPTSQGVWLSGSQIVSVEFFAGTPPPDQQPTIINEGVRDALMSRLGGATSQANKGARGSEDVPDAVQQPAPAAQRPGVCQLADRLLHQHPHPACTRLNARCCPVSRSLVRRSPTGGAFVLLGV